MAKKKPEPQFPNTDSHENITVSQARELNGPGTRIFWRPDGKYDPHNPDNDPAVVIF